MKGQGQSLTETVKQILTGLGHEHVGMTPLSRPLSFDIYKQWVADGYHGKMKYLESHLSKKENWREWVPRAESGIVFLIPYLPHPWPEGQAQNINHLKVARYARGGDYHLGIQQILKSAIETLSQEFPLEEFLVFTDSAPVMERDLAARAGLGWIGKNSCLLNRKAGSLFFIAEILTSLKMEGPTQTYLDHCGTCRRCIDACPTNALREDRTMDARLCISYWTIESADNPPLELSRSFDDWIFGCDICQEVCPWNKKNFAELLKDPLPRREDQIEELRWLLRTSSNALQKELRGTPLSRAAGSKLRRNAMIVARNIGAREVIEDIRFYENHKTLGSLARECLEALGAF